MARSAGKYAARPPHEKECCGRIRAFALLHLSPRRACNDTAGKRAHGPARCGRSSRRRSAAQASVASDGREMSCV